MAQIAEAVHLVTTDGPAGRRGLTVTAFTSVSDKPATVLVCLNRANAANEAFVGNGNFAVSTLASPHRDLADAFSGKSGVEAESRFGLADWEKLETGAPVLIGALAAFDCELIESVDMATHRVLFGRVTGLRIGDSLSPLMYHRRGYRSF
ncbi:MAG: flavin reductase [Phyllobacteriaceae bacterium]|nr:flavin reductase [Phyllobacteriaceae bacterium]